MRGSPGGTRLRVAVVTGSRAEFGLLRPVMSAIGARADLELLVIIAGSHLVPPAETHREVRDSFAGSIADTVPMQTPGQSGRIEDAAALGRGIAGFARAFARLAPDWVVVLGDRIEAFAGGAAASVGGVALAHIHGGDRAEGVADEAMRHAITKLAHLHLAATEESAQRIIRMGERPEMVRVVGSPAIDGLDAIDPMGDAEFERLGSPAVVLLMHPIGRTDDEERRGASAALLAVAGQRVLALEPNLDPGREGILRAIRVGADTPGARIRMVTHLPRDTFVALLKRMADHGGVLVGNSSGALIEGAALRVPAVDVGPRQAGRERAGNVVTVEREDAGEISRAIERARTIDRHAITHPYGRGDAGPRIAAALAGADPRDPHLLRKRCVY